MILEEYLISTLEDLRNKTFTYLSILEYAKENDIDVNILEKEVTKYIKKETNVKRISMYKPIYVKDLKQIKNNYLVLKRINTLLKVLYGKEQSITKEMLLKIGSKEYNYLEEKLATLCYKYAKITDIDVLESNLSLMLELTKPNVVKYLMMGFNANDIMSYKSYVNTQIDKKGVYEVPLSKHSKYLYELDKLTDETQIKEYLKNLKDNGIRLDKIKEDIFI